MRTILHRSILKRRTLQTLFAQAMMIMLTTVWINSLLETPEKKLLQVEESKMGE